jgi:opacity protein-like surface antigen
LFPGDAAPGEGPPANAEYQFGERGSYSYQTSMALTRGPQIGTRLAATAEYGYQDVRQPTITQPDVTTYGIGAGLHHAPSRRQSFSVGYRYRTGAFGSDDRTVGHEVTLGAVYSPALSVSRRLTFRLDVTPTVLDIPGSALPGIGGEEAVGQRLYPVQFDGSMDYPFHLKWRANVGYAHSVSYLAGLSEPTISDTARARLSGVLGRRAEVSFMARYATSGSTSSGDDTYLETYTGEARFSFALGRSFAVYTEYLYAYYEDDAVGRPTLVSRGGYEQHGIRVGITVFTQPFGG